MAVSPFARISSWIMKNSTMREKLLSNLRGEGEKTVVQTRRKNFVYVQSYSTGKETQENAPISRGGMQPKKDRVTSLGIRTTGDTASQTTGLGRVEKGDPCCAKYLPISEKKRSSLPRGAGHHRRSVKPAGTGKKTRWKEDVRRKKRGPPALEKRTSSNHWASCVKNLVQLKKIQLK